jgi:hypothetical protein
LVSLDVGEAAAARTVATGAGDNTDGSGVLEQSLRERAKDAARMCRGQGASLEVVGEVLEAVAVTEIMKAKFVISFLF